jgi:hypothetical protein
MKWCSAVGPRPNSKLRLASCAKRPTRRCVPAVEDRGLQTVLIEQLGNGLMFQQMPPQNGDFLFSGEMLSWFVHASSPLSPR